MTDHRQQSRTEIRMNIVRKFDATPGSRRAATMASLLWRLSKTMAPDADGVAWALLLDIAPSLQKLYDDMRHDDHRAGNMKDDIAALAGLARRDPEAALSIIIDLLAIQSGLLAAEDAITKLLGPRPEDSGEARIFEAGSRGDPDYVNR